jgi:hypothetical protein
LGLIEPFADTQLYGCLEIDLAHGSVYFLVLFFFPPPTWTFGGGIRRGEIIGLVSSTPDSRKLNPYYITGFSDAESCFSVSLSKDSRQKTGWRVRVCFKFGLHSRDLALLGRIQAYFGAGTIYKDVKNSYQFIVQTSK